MPLNLQKMYLLVVVGKRVCGSADFLLWRSVFRSSNPREATNYGGVLSTTNPTTEHVESEPVQQVTWRTFIGVWYLKLRLWWKYFIVIIVYAN